MEIRNILCIRNDRFGEFLLIIPALRALKQNFPGARLILAVHPYVRELAGCIEAVDEVIPWESRKHGFFEILKLSRKLRGKDIGLAVVFNPSKDSHLLAFLTGIPVRAGYDRKWGLLLTHKMKDTKDLGQRHEIESNLELAALIGAVSIDKSLSLRIDDDIINDLLKEYNLMESRELLALHPWTSDPFKQWPIENFVRLAERLAGELKRTVLVIGGREETDNSRTYFSRLGTNIINWTGKTTLPQLAALLKRCRLLISGDSGPVHLASCVSTPALVLFRNDLPGKGPMRWGPVSAGSAVIGKPSLSDITIEEVLEKAERMLEP